MSPLPLGRLRHSPGQAPLVAHLALLPMTSSLPLPAGIAFSLFPPPLPSLRIPSSFNAAYRNKWARSTSRPDLTVHAWYVWRLRLSLRPWPTCWPHPVPPSMRPLTTVSTHALALFPSPHKTALLTTRSGQTVTLTCSTYSASMTLSTFAATPCPPEVARKTPPMLHGSPSSATNSLPMSTLGASCSPSGLMFLHLASAETVGALDTPKNTAAPLSAALCVALPTPAINALLLPGTAANVVALIMLSTAAAQLISWRLRSLVFASVVVSHYVRHIRKPSPRLHPLSSPCCCFCLCLALSSHVLFFPPRSLASLPYPSFHPSISSSFSPSSPPSSISCSNSFAVLDLDTSTSTTACTPAPPSPCPQRSHYQATTPP